MPCSNFTSMKLIGRGLHDKGDDDDDDDNSSGTRWDYVMVSLLNVIQCALEKRWVAQEGSQPWWYCNNA